MTQTPGPQTSATYPLPGTTGSTVSNPAGFTDLSANVIEVGIVDKTTGSFTASSTPSKNPMGGRVAVRFSVTNIGTRTSPQWNFNAVLPTYPSAVFSSPEQQQLGPGDRIEFTLAFDSFDPSGTGTFTVNVDPAGSVNESNKDNNIVHYTVTVAK